jgi:hypothetical protein
MSRFPIRFVAILGLIAGGWVAEAQRIAGAWTGSMSRDGASMPITISFSNVKGHAGGDFTAMYQAVMDYPLDVVSQSGAAIEFVLGGGIKFTGRLDGTRLTRSLVEGPNKGAFSLRRTPKEVLPYRVTEVRFGSKDARLAGMLCIPRGTGKHPGIILLHGSGPQSRWGTLRAAADLMARRGIETLIWDQRGTGASMGQWYKATYDNLLSDALAGIHLLKARPELAPSAPYQWRHPSPGLYDLMIGWIKLRFNGRRDH